MDITTFQSHIQDIQNMLEGLDYYHTYCTVEIEGDRIRFYVNAQAESDSSSNSQTWYYRADGSYNTHDSLDDLIQAISDHIYHLPQGAVLKGVQALEAESKALAAKEAFRNEVIKEQGEQVAEAMELDSMIKSGEAALHTLRGYNANQIALRK